MKQLITLSFILIATYVSAQTLSFTGDMKKPRQSHQCWLLSNGKVLAFGGDNGDFINTVTYKEAELYTPSTGTWAYTASMAYNRTTFASALLDNGKVLAIGGDDFTGKTCELYDPASGLWTSTGAMNEDRAYHAAVKLNNGKVLTAGGGTSKKTELYDPATGTWTYTGDMSIGHGYAMSMTVLADGKVLASGGDDDVIHAELYDPATGTWTLLSAQMNGPRKWHSSILLNNGKVLITGSTDFSEQTTSELYDPISQTFTSTGQMAMERGDCPTIKLANGNVLIFGIGDIFNGANTKMIEIYNVATGTWATQTYTNVGTQDYAIVKLSNGKILVNGGTFTTGNGASTYSWLINDNTVASVQDVNTLSASWKVYPNPASSELRIINMDVSNPAINAVLYDLNGKEVLNCNLKNGEAANVSRLAEGLYLYRLSDPSGNATNGKVRIQH